jgi:hypothetical protein
MKIPIIKIQKFIFILGLSMGITVYVGKAWLCLGLLSLPFLFSNSGRGLPIVGYTIGGLLYLLLALAPRDRLVDSTYVPTTGLIDKIYVWAYPKSTISEESAKYEYCDCDSCSRPYRERYERRREHFMRIGHSFFSLAAGLVALSVGLLLNTMRSQKMRNPRHPPIAVSKQKSQRQL